MKDHEVIAALPVKHFRSKSSTPGSLRNILVIYLGVQAKSWRGTSLILLTPGAEAAENLSLHSKSRSDFSSKVLLLHSLLRRL